MVDCELIAFITAISCGLIKCFSNDDLSILAASFNQLGDTLATYLAQVEVAENRANAKKNDANKQIDTIKDKDA
jgi:hypothetical protein